MGAAMRSTSWYLVLTGMQALQQHISDQVGVWRKMHGLLSATCIRFQELSLEEQSYGIRG